MLAALVQQLGTTGERIERLDIVDHGGELFAFGDDEAPSDGEVGGLAQQITAARMRRETHAVGMLRQRLSLVKHEIALAHEPDGMLPENLHLPSRLDRNGAGEM